MTKQGKQILSKLTELLSESLKLEVYRNTEDLALLREGGCKMREFQERVDEIMKNDLPGHPDKISLHGIAHATKMALSLREQTHEEYHELAGELIAAYKKEIKQ